MLQKTDGSKVRDFCLSLLSSPLSHKLQKAQEYEVRFPSRQRRRLCQYTRNREARSYSHALEEPSPKCSTTEDRNLSRRKASRITPFPLWWGRRHLGNMNRKAAISIVRSLPPPPAVPLYRSAWVSLFAFNSSHGPVALHRIVASHLDHSFHIFRMLDIFLLLYTDPILQTNYRG